MTQTVNIYFQGVKVMTGVATTGSATIGTIADVTDGGNALGGIYSKSGSNTLDSLRGYANFPETAGNGTRTKPPHLPSSHGVVSIQSTSGANALGRSIQTQIITDAGSTSIVLKDKWPFAD
jgi:hypothetical protein